MSNSNAVFIKGDKVNIKAWTKFVPVEEQAEKQLHNLTTLPFIFKHIAVMPDVHWGMGATIGSVIATKGAIIPAALGVDIGCGLVGQQTSLKREDLPTDLSGIRSAIEQLIPHGRTDNGGPNDRGAWGNNDPQNLTLELKAELVSLENRLKFITDKYPTLLRNANRFASHAGTLGSGNHFVELSLDQNDSLWIVIHSGSRGIGNAIGRFFIEKAKEEMARFFIHLVDDDLAYLPEGSVYYNDYLEAVQWAQDFAAVNRAIMLNATLIALHKVLQKPFENKVTAINCHHNYVALENHFDQNVLVTRKGAVRARTTDLAIIPGSMGAKTFVVRGKGNSESFCSCSHGAGRLMSRGEAKRVFTVEDQIRDTEGVECRKDEDVIDETPKAYKNIDDVMRSQDDLVEVLFTLKQIVCVKG
ncbi:RtcB family protein [Klebsiella pneumoniae]|uniref:RtcB family protein n=1 Tax=Klebsiella pneumoniae TaxID=573 RepID=UPI000D1B21D4|nr:RtcB family protein [Klebsiella pneumoniae]